MALGAGQAALEIAIPYAKERIQLVRRSPKNKAIPIN